MTDLEQIRTTIHKRRMTAYEEQTPNQNTARLQVRVPNDLVDLVARLALLIGCKRAEVVSLALKEFAAKIEPSLATNRVHSGTGGQ